MRNTVGSIRTGRRLGFVLILTAVHALLPARLGAAEGQVIVRWVKQAMQVVRLQNAGTPEASRIYAMVTVAMYDAVNRIDTARSGGREHAVVPAGGAPINGDRRVAAAAAAHGVLMLLAPARSNVLDALFAATSRRNGAAARAGQAWGVYVGERVVELRSADGTQMPLAMPAGSAPGSHRATFDARWQYMAPFGIASGAAYRSPPPPRLESAEYARAFDEVKALGAPDDDPERDEIASFWFAEAGTSRETGLWLQAAIAVARQRRTVHSLADTARLFALTGMAIADSVMVSWGVKADYFSWRPAVAIREAATDGNPATVPHPAWTPRWGATGASPEYNSGTSTFGGAVSRVLELFYGDAAIGFCFETEEATAGARYYASPLQAAQEAGWSRILQGIHFRFSDEDGRRLGRAIGEEIAATRLRPIG